ncbi:MAG TPA: hypothetical protein VFA75_00400 [Nevskia sp.]|nr:hypothetical protein [Nevskia sp.]
MSFKTMEPATPLILALVEPPGPCDYTAAVGLAEQIGEQYDPITQTSPVPAYAGTDATVCWAGTGTVIWGDNSYPTDDA